MHRGTGGRALPAGAAHPAGARQLNTHTGASLYEAFEPAEARRLLDRLEFHHTPKHASWLNMAEIEIGIVGRQCLGGRIDDAARMAEEIGARERERNAAEAKIHWSFTRSPLPATR